MKYNNRVRTFFSIVVIWAIGTVVGTHLEAEPYPAMAYPGFGSKGRKHIVYYELFHVKNDKTYEITFANTPLQVARFRRFLKNLYVNTKQIDKSKLQIQIKTLIALPNLKKGDTIRILERRANWQTGYLELATGDSQNVLLNLDEQ